MPLIKVQDLKKDYVNEDVTTSVLHGVNFSIEKGECVAIMGPSGSGKSTLMHILSFLDRPTGGVYEFDGHDIKNFSDDYLAELRNERVGFVMLASLTFASICKLFTSCSTIASFKAVTCSPNLISTLVITPPVGALSTVLS